MAGVVRVAAVVVVALALAAAPARAQTPGAAGLGDPFFPKAGNGGYDVRHYGMRLHFDPERDRLRARVGIRAIASQDLSRFHLDFRGPEIRKLELNGTRAQFRRRGQELIVSPDEPIANGERFSVAVRYAGRPHPIEDPDGSREGWFHTRDGSVVVAEPQGSPAWYPANDHPTDKARYTFEIFVPRGLEAIANGRLLDRRRIGDQSLWHWKQREPMAPYLATVATGRFRLDRSRVGGLRSVVAVDPRLWKQSRGPLRRSGQILDLLVELFGPYPFRDVGAIVDDAEFIGYALETQTRPVYDRPPDEILIAHELAHQWIGNSVTLSSWPEIWLHEGFATWAEWRWIEQDGGPTTARTFDDLYATPASDTDFWNPAPAALPGPQSLFTDTVYVRGAMALEVLRQEIGNETFLALLREWAQANAYGNVTIAEFIELAETRAGDPTLSETVFQPWLYAQGKPSRP